MNDLMEVYFNLYCCKCQYEKTKEIDYPCCECLSIPGRVDSHKPELFKEKEKE